MDKSFEICYDARFSGFPADILYKEGYMRQIFLVIAVWNTLVAIINVTVLPHFVPAEAMVYVTPMSQLLPIFIPIVLSSVSSSSGSNTFGELRSVFL